MRLLLIMLLLIPSICQANTRDGLVGWWKMDEGTGTTTFDSSWTGNSGTLTNTPTWVSNCPRGNCLKFVTSSTQYVDLGSNFGPTSGTITAWVNATSFPNSYNSVINKNVSTTATFFILIKSTGKLACYIRQADSTALSYDGTGTNTLVAGTWYFLAFSYSSSNGGKGYVNGAVDGTFAAGTALNTTLGSMRIGSDPQVASREWNGLIDDVRIYNRVLTSQEVIDLYNQGIRINYAPNT